MNKIVENYKRAELLEAYFDTKTLDASVWADEFCKLFPEMDRGLMLGWFANAIMAGYDYLN